MYTFAAAGGELSFEVSLQDLWMRSVLEYTEETGQQVHKNTIVVLKTSGQNARYLRAI
jgi:hypothetical protein